MTWYAIIEGQRLAEHHQAPPAIIRRLRTRTYNTSMAKARFLAEELRSSVFNPRRVRVFEVSRECEVRPKPRILVVGERTQPGDEVRLKGGQWEPIQSTGYVLKPHHNKVRRMSW